MSIVALVLPVAYIKGRPYIIEKSDQLYYKIFGVNQEQYEKMKEQLAYLINSRHAVWP